MKTMTADINLSDEIQAVADFLTETWDSVENILAIVTEVQKAAARTGRGWLTDYTLGSLFYAKQKQRSEFLEKFLPSPSERERSLGARYDAAARIFSYMHLNSNKLVEIGKKLDGSWDYSSKVDDCYAEMAKKYPTLKSAKPKGWAELAKGYTDFDGQEEFNCTKARDDFNGVDATVGGSSEFPVRVGLPYVMYDDKCHGRKPPRVLIAAVFSHFMSIQEFLNTQLVITAIDKLVVPESAEVIFDFEVKSDNPFIQALLLLDAPGYTESEYLAARDSLREFEALSSEEQAAVVSQNKAAMRESLKNMWAKKDSSKTPEESPKEVACKTFLKAALA